MKKQTRETCEMCSAETNNPTTIKVAGALLRVCSNCTTFGNVVVQKNAPENQTRKKIRKQSRSSPPRQRSTGRLNPRPTKIEDELIDDFDRIIKSGRMKKKLSHEQLSSLTGISVASLKSIEAGKIRPTDRDARIIQRELKVSLFTKLDVEPEFADKKKKKATTLGDIAVFRKFNDE